MSFRAILFLSIFSAVLAAAFIEASLDVLAARANAWALERVADQEADPLTGLEQLLTSRLVADVVDLPLFFALALTVAWFLGRLIMRPVRDLTTATEQLAMQQIPEPLVVPPGNDELSHLARTFNVMSASLNGFIERERTFTRYASHELRTPLSALKAQVERAEMGLVPASSILPAIDRNIARMEAVLQALLALARSAEHERQEAVLLPLLHEVLSSFSTSERQRVAFSHRINAPLKVADRQLSIQAVRNLLENALKYSTGPVDLEVQARDGCAHIRVADHGEGVPESLLGRLTEPFFRVEQVGRELPRIEGEWAESGSRKQNPGLGLGLSFVDSISRSLGGRLMLRNTATGFEAVVTLPLANRTGGATTELSVG